jgi:hypothetical protein
MALTVLATVIPDRAGVAVDVTTLSGDPISAFPNAIPAGKTNIAQNPDFAVDASFWSVFGATSSAVTAGQLVVQVPGGTTQYDVQVVQNIPSSATTYHIQFSAKASAPVTLNVVFGPVVQVPIDTVMRKYSVFITTTANAGNQLSFAIGGAAAAWTFTLDNVTVTTTGAGTTTATTKELGVRFTVSTPGGITAIRFWKPFGDTQTTRALSLWDVATGTKLGTVNTVNETATTQGWITATLPSTVAVVTGKTYAASYTSTAPGLWANSATAPTYPVAAGPVSMTTGVNGNAGTHPTTLDAALNHMVDVVYFTGSAVTAVTIGRQDPGGFQQILRYGDAVPIVDGKLHIEDFEAPLDVPVYYTAAQQAPAGSEVGVSNTVIVPSQGRTWLKDPSYPSRNMVVPVMTSVVNLTRAAQAGIFPILNRPSPVVITTVRAGPEAVITLHTLTDEQRKAMVNILASGSVLLIQTAPNELGSIYVHVGDVVEERVGLVQEQSRRWTLPVIVVDRPAGLANASTLDRSWRKVRTTYLTWGDLIATGKTNQQLLDGGA